MQFFGFPVQFLQRFFCNVSTRCEEQFSQEVECADWIQSGASLPFWTICINILKHQFLMLVLTAFSWNDCCFTSPRFVGPSTASLHLSGYWVTVSLKKMWGTACVTSSGLWLVASRAAGNRDDTGNRRSTRVRDDYWGAWYWNDNRLWIQLSCEHTTGMRVRKKTGRNWKWYKEVDKISQQWRLWQIQRTTSKELTQQTILLSSSWLAFSHHSLEKEQQPPWMQGGCTGLEYTGSKAEPRGGVETSRPYLWFTCCLDLHCRDCLEGWKPLVFKEGEFGRALNSEGEREGYPRRKLIPHANEMNNCICRKAAREGFG